ncbi:MAG: Ig-like domain-containing protein [Oscillospiraceae bacterium]|jgi:hypothetical protein|nr:Ig-like domain-containing protein [Oscillospiraceae bacterium]
MAIVPDVKCKKCDRRFSGIRSRCPYCGARRGSPGKHAGGDDSFKGKATIGILILSALIIAVGALLFTSLADRGDDPPSDPSGAVTDDPGGSPDIPDDSDVNTQPGTQPTLTPTPTPSPSPSPTPQPVESVQMTYAGTAISEEFSVWTGEEVALKARTVPAETEYTPVWESSDEEVFMVNQDGTVTGIGRGTAKLTVTVGGATAECIVRGKGPRPS